ncbi:hypothetical protein EKH57_17905 (plasmid) [Halorubrum sp. BOL3-1]|uniref:hypothetical protein n=1 Tax=Halorubrum sp. BOL3-1 TaxID=2497325 RepID=UPI001004EA68|nr:hypothetical protein [Halorubrum sp. BOL3-1]QAU14547.1 hypothetical protein EKH57_17905 [Halorubrum sp. BOL3-1]
MSHHVNFVAVLAESVTEEFDEPPDELDDEELAAAAEDHFDAMSEAELRSLYRDGPITVDDAFEEQSEAESEA